MNSEPLRGPFYKRPGGRRALATVPRERHRKLEELASGPPPLAFRPLDELRRAAEELGIEPERLNRRELLDSIRDSLPRGNARALGL